MRKFTLVALLVGSCAIAYAQTSPFDKKFPTIDKYIDSFMKAWNIPGLAMGIVYKDKLIYAKGYGYRDLEAKLPVTATTIFPIASNTKLFTATAATMLAVEGKLNLDKPARTYLPSLNFSNDELNAKVTVRDMLSHRTGLPRYDAIWVAAPFSRKEVLEKIVYMKPQFGFREGYIYNNMMFVASGAVEEAVTGKSWEDLIREKLLQPLAMNATGYTDEETRKSGNFAWAYYAPDSSNKLLKKTFNAQCPALGPAGIIKSNVEDMSHWMIAQLNQGKYNGVQVIPDAAIKETLIPQNIADKDGRWPELSNGLYGLGRIIQTYKGYKIATHTGSIDGYYSNLTFIPSEGIAVFMVHNSVPAGSVRSMMAFPVIDRLMGLSTTPWSERYMDDYRKGLAAEKKAKDSILATAVKNTNPSHPLKEFVGQFSSPIYGEMGVEWSNDQLYLVYRGNKFLLKHLHYDQFYTDEAALDRPDFRVHFETNMKGEVGKMNVWLGDPVAEFVRIK